MTLPAITIVKVGVPKHASVLPFATSGVYQLRRASKRDSGTSAAAGQGGLERQISRGASKVQGPFLVMLATADRQTHECT